MMSTKTCILCFGPLLKGTDSNLVNGKSKIIVEVEDLPFVVHDCSPYICKKCLGARKKCSNLKKNLKIVEDELMSLYHQKCGEHHSNFNGAILAPKGRFGFLDVGPFWLHTGAKTEHLGHFGTRQGCFGSNLNAVLVI